MTRRAPFWIGFVCAASLVAWGAIIVLPIPSRFDPVMVQGVWDKLLPALARLRDRKPSGDDWVYFGDSVSIFYSPASSRVPQRLEQELRGQGRSTRIFPIAYGGMQAFDYYALADEVIASRPDHLLMTVNLFSLSAAWRSSVVRPEMAAFISPSRWVEAGALPLYWQKVTLDSLLFQSSVLHGVGVNAWLRGRDVFARVRTGFRRFGDWIGSESSRMQAAQLVLDQWWVGRGGGPRQGRRDVLKRYGDALAGVAPDHPVLRLYGAAVRAYERAGIPVTVIVIPINVDYFEQIGVLDKTGLTRTIDSLRVVTERHGGDFVDLHGEFSDSLFRDAAGHLTQNSGRGDRGADGPDLDGPRHLARRIARSLWQRPSADGR